LSLREGRGEKIPSLVASRRAWCFAETLLLSSGDSPRETNGKRRLVVGQGLRAGPPHELVAKRQSSA
jgi:hypothetical protein